MKIPMKMSIKVPESGAILMRGLAMGAADIVPGVSGGTVAFITGIYPRLLNSLRSFDMQCLRLLWARDIGAAWRHVDGGFLAWLLTGILISVFTLARLLGYLLQHYPEPLWAFFFGLILASALLLYGQMNRREWLHLGALAAGAAVALWVALSPRSELFASGYVAVFLAGFIAVCAMILPGISGSFILVLLGMYPLVLAAVNGLDIPFLVVLVGGAACGLLCFSRVLHWLLSRYRDVTVALLTGFLFGSLAAVWPWKRTLGWMVDGQGDMVPVQQVPVLPREYLARTGEDPLLAGCLLLAVLGVAVVWLVGRRGGAAGTAVS